MLLDVPYRQKVGDRYLTDGWKSGAPPGISYLPRVLPSRCPNFIRLSHHLSLWVYLSLQVAYWWPRQYAGCGGFMLIDWVCKPDAPGHHHFFVALSPFRPSAVSSGLLYRQSHSIIGATLRHGLVWFWYQVFRFDLNNAKKPRSLFVGYDSWWIGYLRMKTFRGRRDCIQQGGLLSLSWLRSHHRLIIQKLEIIIVDEYWYCVENVQLLYQQSWSQVIIILSYENEFRLLQHKNALYPNVSQCISCTEIANPVSADSLFHFKFSSIIIQSCWRRHLNKNTMSEHRRSMKERNRTQKSMVEQSMKGYERARKSRKSTKEYDRAW